MTLMLVTSKERLRLFIWVICLSIGYYGIKGGIFTICAMQTLADLGVTGLIEIPPAGTLVGLAKRGLKGVDTLALKSPDDLEAAARMIHGAGDRDDTGPSHHLPEEDSL